MRDVATLRSEAEALLRSNDRGGYTVPAPRLYPHQWNWDSAFAAIGWRHIDPRRAARELEMLLRGQWDDGLIPHIIFNPASNYEPGPKQWRTEGVRGAPTAAPASSITQPPIAASAVRLVLERAGGDAEVEASLRRTVAGLERWHQWFADTRDPTGLGVVCIVHPWESGMDNAPRWDAAMNRIEPGVVEYKRVDNTIVDASERPTRGEYDRYFYMVHERARLGFAPPRPETEPLLIADVAMSAILCRAEEDLAWLGQALGVATPGAVARHARLAAAFDRLLWNDARASYCDLDIKAGAARIPVEHIANYVPLYAGVVSKERARILAARLADPTLYAAAWPVPTVPLADPAFEPRRYWRGPTWINVNWMLIDGLRHAGFDDQAARLREQTIELVARSGFREYYDCRTGEGLGADDFTWTASLAIDLLAR